MSILGLTPRRPLQHSHTMNFKSKATLWMVREKDGASGRASRQRALPTPFDTVVLWRRQADTVDGNVEKRTYCICTGSVIIRMLFEPRTRCDSVSHRVSNSA